MLFLEPNQTNPKGDLKVDERTTFMEYLCNEWNQGYRLNRHWNAHLVEPFLLMKKKNKFNKYTSFILKLSLVTNQADPFEGL